LTAYTQRTAPPPAMAELNVLAVGDGQCVVLRTPSGKTFIIDAGTRNSTDVAGRILEPFILRQRLPEPTAAFVSHANTDHYNALPSLDGLQQIYVNDDFPDLAMSKNSPDSGLVAAGLMLNELQTSGVKVVRICAGMKIALDERTFVEVVWPPALPDRKINFKDINDTSLVLRITCDGQRVILPGDVDTVAQAALALDPSALQADVMLLPHHGSWRPTVPGFVKAVNPRHIISSNSYEFRAPAGIAAAREFFTQLHTGRLFYSTAHNGWIKVKFGGGMVEVQTMR
ncbi:MAG: MBL fold metallo-hydrolase, partial [Planctomycetaceae bacterium]